MGVGGTLVNVGVVPVAVGGRLAVDVGVNSPAPGVPLARAHAAKTSKPSTNASRSAMCEPYFMAYSPYLVIAQFLSCRLPLSPCANLSEQEVGMSISP